MIYFELRTAIKIEQSNIHIRCLLSRRFLCSLVFSGQRVTTWKGRPHWQGYSFSLVSWELRGGSNFNPVFGKEFCGFTPLGQWVPWLQIERVCAVIIPSRSSIAAAVLTITDKANPSVSANTACKLWIVDVTTVDRDSLSLKFGFDLLGIRA